MPMPPRNEQALYNAVRCDGHKEALDEITRWIKTHCEDYRQLSVEMAELTTKVVHEREVRERAFGERDRTLALQAQEYERRLADLNHNLRMMLDDRKMFFTRDQHDAFAAEMSRFRDETKAHQTAVVTWGAAGLLVLGVLEFALRFILK